MSDRISSERLAYILDECDAYEKCGNTPSIGYYCDCYPQDIIAALRELRELRELRSNGGVVVPTEPTKEMIAAGQDEHDNCIDTGYDSNADGDRFEYTTISPDAPYRIYRSMIAARPKD